MDATREQPRRRFRKGSLLGVVALLGGVAFPVSFAVGSEDASAAPCAVSMSGFRFNPDDCAVNLGETVTWTHNQPGATHTVTSDSDPEAWSDSGFMSAGQSFGPVTFTEPGDYAYHCRVHPDVMTGVIHVT